MVNDPKHYLPALILQRTSSNRNHGCYLGRNLLWVFQTFLLGPFLFSILDRGMSGRTQIWQNSKSPLPTGKSTARVTLAWKGTKKTLKGWFARIAKALSICTRHPVWRELLKQWHSRISTDLIKSQQRLILITKWSNCGWKRGMYRCNLKN